MEYGRIFYPKKWGSICSGTKGSIYFGTEGSITIGKKGSISSAFPYTLSNIGVMSKEGQIVSLSKINKGNKFAIYPNPSRNGKIIINSDHYPTQIKIYNALGQMVFEKKTINTLEYETDLISGIYFLEIFFEGNYYYSKWVVER